MKMLSKENLMARTSDIGSCLGLLAGKILSVGFVVVISIHNTICAMHSDIYGTEDMRELASKTLFQRDSLQQQLEELQEKLDQVNAVQSRRQTPRESIRYCSKCLLKDALSEDSLSEDSLMIEKQKENVKPSSSLWGICCGAR
jgi:hypothetical protein